MTSIGWMQCVQPFPGDERVFESFERLFRAAGGPRDAALFSRQSENFKEHIYLISPKAAEWAELLLGSWESCPDATAHR